MQKVYYAILTLDQFLPYETFVTETVFEAFGCDPQALERMAHAEADKIAQASQWAVKSQGHTAALNREQQARCVHSVCTVRIDESFQPEKLYTLELGQLQLSC